MLRFILATIGFTLLLGGPAMAVEEPAYRVVMTDQDFELRAYPSLVAAEVALDADRNRAGNLGFRALAGYIFGGNARSESIAMTAPVVMAPLTPAGSSEAWSVRFFMPSGYSLETLPPPKDTRVHLQAVPATEIATVRFSGLASETSAAEQTARLQGFIEAHHWKATGPASLARYNPPWTPWFMRRNEIWIPVKTGNP